LNKDLKKLTLWVVFLVQMFLCQGCTLFGFLAEPGQYEKKIKPDYDLKSNLKEKKLLVWVEALPGSGADVGIAKQLNQAILSQLRKKAGIADKAILAQDTLYTAAYDPSQSPAAIGRQAGAGMVLYVRLEDFENLELHKEKICSGQMRARAVLIDSQSEEILCPTDSRGLVAEVATELATDGRESLTLTLNAAAAHCIVRHFYVCPRTEYKVNEERSTLNEMIREDVY
jgi:hypothetical protein